MSRISSKKFSAGHKSTKVVKPDQRQKQPEDQQKILTSSPDLVLKETEKTVWQVLSQKPVHIDQIITSTGLTAHEVHVILLNLELQGLIEQKAGQDLHAQES